MKNKFLAMAFIALGFGTTLVSCTKDDSPIASKAVETTKVEFAVSAENGTTAKSTISKDAVPAYVNDVTITATSALGYPYNVTQSFDFGTSTTANPLPSGFFLNNVALGSNTFNASSGGVDSDQRLSLGDVSGSDVLATMKAHTPYIGQAYSYDNPTATIVKGTNAKVNIKMKTDFGRILAKFVQEGDVANYIVTVSTTTPNGTWDGADGGDSYTTLPETVVGSSTGFEWSNRGTTFINSATFTIKIYAKNADGSRGALVNTLADKSVQVQASTTKLVTFTIHNAEVHTDIETSGITLTFPTITDLPINM